MADVEEGTPSEAGDKKEEEAKGITKRFQDFIKPKYRTFKGFVVDYNEGLYGLLMALIAFGLEEIVNAEAFNCPSNNYQIYAISFFVAPAVLLMILNLLTIPAQGGINVWTLCESCYINDYRRYGDCCSSFMSALLVGCVAPVVWLVTALVNERHLVCWELGFQFGDNVTEDYLKVRGFDYFKIERYEAKVEHAKSKSHASGVILLAVSVLFLGLFIIIRRSCQKPYQHDKKLPAVWELEKREALAASDWLEYLITTGTEGHEVPNVFKNLMMSNILARMRDEQVALKDGNEERKEGELAKEIKELDKLMATWNAYCKFDGYGRTPPGSKAEKEYKEAREAYEDERKRVGAERRGRIDEAETELLRLSKEPGEDHVKDVEDIKFYSWLVDRLRHQEPYLDLASFMEGWEPSEAEQSSIRELANTKVRQGFIDTPEETGRYIATCIMQLARLNGGLRVNDEAMKIFEKVYPRAATCKPWHRYKFIGSESDGSKYIEMMKSDLGDGGATSSGGSGQDPDPVDKSTGNIGYTRTGKIFKYLGRRTRFDVERKPFLQEI